MIAILKRSIGNLGVVLSDRKARVIAAVTGFIYFIIYLAVIGDVVYSAHTRLSSTVAIPSLQLVRDWPTKILKPISPFVWEPIAAIYPAKGLMLLISVPNIFIDLLLAMLVGLNASVAIYAFAQPRACRGTSGPLMGIAGVVPSLFAGFACCVPTVVLMLGSLMAGATLGMITIQPFFIPASFGLLLFSLVWSTTSRLKPNVAVPQSTEARLQ